MLFSSFVPTAQTRDGIPRGATPYPSLLSLSEESIGIVDGSPAREPGAGPGLNTMDLPTDGHKLGHVVPTARFRPFDNRRFLIVRIKLQPF